MTNACSREPINPRWSTLGRGPSLSFQPALLQHSLQRRLERALFHLEEIVGDLFDVLHQRIAMHGLQPQRLENHDLQCAREKVAMFRVFRHSGNYRTRIPILEIGIYRKILLAMVAPAPRKNSPELAPLFPGFGVLAFPVADRARNQVLVLAVVMLAADLERKSRSVVTAVRAQLRSRLVQCSR